MLSALALMLGLLHFLATFLTSLNICGISAIVVKYHCKYMGDHPGIKWMVLKAPDSTAHKGETLSQILAIHGQWHYLVEKCGNDCLYSYWSPNAQTIPQQLCSFVTKCFFVARIWKFSEHKAMWLLAVPYTISLISLFSKLAYQTQTLLCLLHGFSQFGEVLFKYPTFLDYDPNSPQYPMIHKLLMVSAAGALITDVGITIGMCYLLHIARKLGGPSSSICEILHMITCYPIMFTWQFMTLPGTFVFDEVFYVLGMVDVNCMLAALNSREYFRGKLKHVQTL
ncbi:hypothetical protein GLOTRDRAFT_95220 [Gloeophyllum trabeum ATCC 11539]|uniref:DUF6534 domain-containing protein n=1 Tax=Gloeophyllum trabeum (strain ATCC 11539 / FP-39264 / Madison 617) TaxID=670483 RepID=S7RG60_GLOTA|nr:uncharacterized protein GLOTRDRAFT_95220 [Gloeophyllum trabeum ATCC 11539]EPQ53220.1 hypothetical protein GLOTRDRAFT_95220 [Gloeophyllum trabeum ATCC 11539]